MCDGCCTLYDELRGAYSSGMKLEPLFRLPNIVVDALNARKERNGTPAGILARLPLFRHITHLLTT